MVSHFSAIATKWEASAVVSAASRSFPALVMASELFILAGYREEVPCSHPLAGAANRPAGDDSVCKSRVSGVTLLGGWPDTMIIP